MQQPQALNRHHRTFKKTIGRSFNLLRTFDHARIPAGNRRIRQPDLLRAAVVVSVAGMDAYFTSRSVDAASRIIQSGRTLSDEFVNFLQAAGINERYLLSILGNPRPVRSIRNQIEKFVSMKVTQSFQAIDNTYAVMGLKDLSKHACKRAKMARLEPGVARIVLRRHQIVHDSDYNRRGSLRKIERNYVERHVRYIEAFVDNAEVIITSFTNNI